MATIEESVKSQFAKVFAASDWHLFKTVAESNLCEAANLMMTDMAIHNGLKLLARNSRKRLLIGIGVELLLKAVYLKHGYLINKPPRGSPLKLPFKAKDADAAGVALNAAETFTLSELIESLTKVIHLQAKEVTIKGLKIAKVFRNKEGHVVTIAHTFDPTNYTDIASSLSALYWAAFGERLSVRFSLESNESPVWQVSPEQSPAGSP